MPLRKNDRENDARQKAGGRSHASRRSKEAAGSRHAAAGAGHAAPGADAQGGPSRTSASPESAVFYSADASAATAGKQQGTVRRVVDQWWDRLIGAVYSRSFADQTQQYEAHQSTRDYIFNTVGQGVWGALFPILSMIATHLVGAEAAGMFTMAFVVANLLQFVANYGVRTFQVSDIDENESFAAYEIHRVLCCAIMLAAGWLYCQLRGYGDQMLLICAGTFGFRCVDALADVYEGRLQQSDKLYLAGISQGVRCVAVIILFTMVLLVTGDLGAASIALTVGALATLLVVTLPLTWMETTRSRKWEFIEIKELFVDCFPAFAAQFLFCLIETMPKFAMESMLPYDNQVYFNAIYFPAQAILMIVGFAYKPQLVRITQIWNDRERRGRFNLIVIAMLAVCVGVTLVMLVVFGTIGIPLNGILYGLDFEPYRRAQYLMIIAGGFSAAIDFLYQIICVLRQQAAATRVYLVAFVVASALSYLLVLTIGFDGAVYAYLVVMMVLFVLLLVLYIRLRIKDKR